MEWEPLPQHTQNEGAQVAAKLAGWVESYCFIRVKDGSLRRVRFNAVQLVLLQFVAWRWAHGLPVRALIPKFRQGGVTTFWLLLELGLCELFPGYQCAVVAHDDDGLTQIMSKVRVVKEAMGLTEYGSFRLVSDQQGLLRWDTDSALFSMLIRTGDAMGKAGTPSSVHMSEMASFRDKGFDPEDGIKSVLAALAHHRWMLETYESTAKGRDPTFWARCERALDPAEGSTLSVIFLPWFLDPGYRMSWEHFRKDRLLSGKDDPGPAFERTADEESLAGRLATAEVPKNQRTLRYRVVLEDEQLIWRRWAFHNTCEGDHDTLKRYFPSFYEECFTASTSGAFRPEAIERQRLRGKEPLHRGVVRRHGRPLFLNDPTGLIRVWEHPYPHVGYIIGADQGGERAKSDPSCAYVLSRASRRVVAQLYGRPDWAELTDALEALGYYYNQALLVVENNFNPAVPGALHQRGYPNLFYYFPDQVVDPHVGKVPGFSTNKKTRKELEAMIRHVLNADLVECFDPDLWKEMETFVWCPRSGQAGRPEMDGTYRATGTNHDDRIVALALAARFLDHVEELTPIVHVEEDPVLRHWQEHLRRGAVTAKLF